MILGVVLCWNYVLKCLGGLSDKEVIGSGWIELISALIT